MARNQQLVRVLGVLGDLARMGGVDVYELAERHGASVRTIRRDLAALEEAGVPLVAEVRGARKAWRVDARSPLRVLVRLLDARHYLALRLAMDQGGAHRTSSSVYADLEDLADKLERSLGPAMRRRLAAIEGCFHVYDKQAWRRAPPDVFGPLVEAIAGRRLCRVTYRAPRSPAEDRTFRVLPLRLFAHGGAIHLMAHHPRHGTNLNLNLHRLVRLEVLDERGEPPAGFDPQALEESAFGVFHDGPPTRYRLRFAPEVAPYIRERTWHPTQQVLELADGGVELRFRCAASWEVTAWVASWREGVEVLEPASLRRELADLGAWLVARYAAGAAGDGSG